MATVHLGRLQGPVGFSRTVAIKRLHEQYAMDPEFVSSFLDEARLAARIRHPNVVPTLDVVATEGQLFLVMEYVQGESLARLLRSIGARGERMPPPIAVGIIVGVLHGLHAAHEAKTERGEPLHIVHRDMSPQNVMVGIDGVPRIVDFGIAKAVGRLQSTRDGQLKGKLAYMAPEQIQSEKVDRRTDIYAAAVVAWETLTAKRLFAADNDAALLARVLGGAVQAPSTVSPELAALDAIVMRGLQHDRDKRWATARDMALALEDALPPATASQIGAWVERVAAEILAARATAVAEIESSDTADDQVSAILSEIRKTGPPDSLPEMPTATDRSLSLATPAGVPSRSRRWPLLVGLVVAVAFASTVFALVWGHDRSGSAATVSAPTASAASVVPPPWLPTAPTVASAVPSATSVASLAPTQTPSSPPTQASAKPPVHFVPPPPVSSKVDCSSPYSFDAMGRKIYKKECLQ